MATVTDGFEDLPVQDHGSSITRPAFTLEVPPQGGTTLEAVKDPEDLKQGIWVKYKWGSHHSENDTMIVTLGGAGATRVTFVNYRTVAGVPCSFHDADGRQLGTAALPLRSTTPVVCASAVAAIKTIRISVAGGPGAYIIFDDFTIESA